MSHDVVVIGAGPAGLSAGVTLARGGVSVLVCERAGPDFDKPCGEGLLPSAVQELVALGVERHSLSRAGYELRGVRYVSARGAQADGRFRYGAGLGLRRRELLRLLREVAEGTPGLELRRGSARVICDGETCRVRLGDADVTPRRLVIAADGLASQARRDAGLRFEQPFPRRYGIRQHYLVAPWSDLVEVHFHAEGEAYVTPVSRREVNVAVLWRPGAGVRGSPLPRFVAGGGGLAERLRGSQPSGSPEGRGPLRARVPKPARDGLLLLGDAAGYVDAITGEGVGLSLRKSRLLTRHLVPLLRRSGDQLPAQLLGPYIHASRRLERAHLQLTHALLWLRRAPWLLERVIAALAHDPALFTHLLEANQGAASPFAVPPRSVSALLSSVLRQG